MFRSDSPSTFISASSITSTSGFCGWFGWYWNELISICPASGSLGEYFCCPALSTGGAVASGGRLVTSPGATVEKWGEVPISYTHTPLMPELVSLWERKIYMKWQDGRFSETIFCSESFLLCQLPNRSLLIRGGAVILALAWKKISVDQTLTESSMHYHIASSYRCGWKLYSIPCVEKNGIRSSVQGCKNQLVGVSLSKIKCHKGY